MGDVVELKAVNPSTFEDFWDRQHHKTGRLIAEIKWKAITSKEGLSTKIRDPETGELHEVSLKATGEEIIKGYKAYIESTMGGRPTYLMTLEERQYLMRPTTFLNRGGWLDG